VTLTPDEFTYACVNTFSEEDAAAAYQRYAVPETGQIFYAGGFANLHLHPTEVHFKKRGARHCCSSPRPRTTPCRRR
jgi:hypothetical protein